MIITEKNIEHQYELRSCHNCEKLGSCIGTKNRDETMMWCDLAKYGCINYKGEFINELSKDEKEESNESF